MAANTVGAVAARTGVSVRTHHHDDHIGLVVPSVRTAASYRGYAYADVERLHLVVVCRRQHRLLPEQADRLRSVSAATTALGRRVLVPRDALPWKRSSSGFQNGMWIFRMRVGHRHRQPGAGSPSRHSSLVSIDQ